MKYFTLIALTLFTTAQVWAGPTVFGDVKSEIAGDFLNMVQASAERDEIFTWENTDIYSVIQITEQGTYELTNGTKTMVTVSLGYSEDDDEPEVLPFGTFYMYAPLKTRILMLDSSRKEESLTEAMNYLDDSAVMLTQEFFELYESRQRESLEMMIQSEIRNYSTKVVQWYKAPRPEGGSGPDTLGTTQGDLAQFMGFDPMSFSLSGYNVIYNIVTLTSSGVILAGTLMDDRYSEGPLYFAEIKFPACEILVSKNPVYRER